MLLVFVVVVRCVLSFACVVYCRVLSLLRVLVLLFVDGMLSCLLFVVVD